MELNNLKNLTELRLSSNYFTGKIHSFRSWPSLQKLELQGSGFEGPIPSSISLLKHLTELKISDLNGGASDFPQLRDMGQMSRLVICTVSLFSTVKNTTLSSFSRAEVGAKVALKSVFDSSKIVAICVLQSLDPLKRVGQVLLGDKWCEIIITVAVDFDEDLVRPTSHFRTIGDSVGEVVVWPKNLVAMDQERGV